MTQNETLPTEKKEQGKAANLVPYDQLEDYYFASRYNQEGEPLGLDLSRDVAFFDLIHPDLHDRIVQLSDNLVRALTVDYEEPVLEQPRFRRFWSALMYNVRHDTVNKDHPAKPLFLDVIRRSKGVIKHLSVETEGSDVMGQDRQRIMAYYSKLERFLATELKNIFRQLGIDPEMKVLGQDVAVADYYVRQLLLTSRDASSHPKNISNLKTNTYTEKFIEWPSA